MKIEYSKILYKIAKALAIYAPDECITTISICRAVPNHKPNPELRISHFDPKVPPGHATVIDEDKMKVEDGVRVKLTYFGKKREVV